MKSHLIPRRMVISMMFAIPSLFSVLPAYAQQVAADAIVGTWEADDGTVKLDMVKDGPEFQAHLLYGNQVVESDNVTFRNDAKNPDPALRSRSLKNIVFLRGLRWEDGKWSGGSLYDASSGRTYRCEVALEDDKMRLRGYIGIPALGQTRVFHRVSQ